MKLIFSPVPSRSSRTENTSALLVAQFERKITQQVAADHVLSSTAPIGCTKRRRGYTRTQLSTSCHEEFSHLALRGRWRPRDKGSLKLVTSTAADRKCGYVREEPY